MKVFKIGIPLSLVILIAVGAIGTVTAMVLFNSSQSPRDKRSISDELLPKPSINKKIIEINEEDLKTVIDESLSKYLSVSNLSIVVSSDKTVMISSEIKTNDLSKLIEQSNIKIPAAAKLFLRFLPESVTTKLKLAVYTDTEKKLILLEPVNFIINDVEASGSLLPDKIKASLNDSINQYLTSKNIIINNLEFNDGKIIIKPF